MFTLEKKDEKTFARAGTVHLYHGDVQTPVFMPVGTNGPVKTFLPYEIKEINAQIMLSNAYHLYLRPGLEVIEEMGGLHAFAGWDRNILTDSGGFQIFSLSSLNKIKNDGIEFRSHIDGSKHFLSPENVVDVQRILGSDIMMVLDHCTPPEITHNQATKAVDTTTRWAARSREHYAKIINPERQKQFGI
ncbi:MAG: tRNA-guanine transglycosylase, partial [Spirochaetales bacterium]|nr:tRNA-guanine transglycosylase [Spirochaetales bacterium]